MRLTSFLLFLLPALAVAQVWEKPVAPGLTYRMEVDSSAPRVIHALRWSLNSPDVVARAELAGGTINEEGTVKGRLTPSKMVVEAGALAGINGDFFSFDHGAPIGYMIRAGELVTTPVKARATFGWGPGVSMGLPSWSGTLVGQDVRFDLNNVNQVIGQNQTVLYTSAAGVVTTPSDGLAVVLRLPKGKLKPNSDSLATVDYIVSESKKMAVPTDTLLLVGRGNKSVALATLRPGMELKVRVDLKGLDLSLIEHAIGGGPFLLKGGSIEVDAEAQGFNAAFRARHPRTAVGRTTENDIWFVAIDGRQPMSIGATLDETAKIMRQLECVDAINLDGGGSTALNVLGVTVNRPSDKSERPVSNGVLFMGPKPKPGLGEITMTTPATLFIGDQVPIRLLADGMEVPQSEIIWGAQGAAWIDQGGLLRALEPGKATVTAYVRGRIMTATVTVLAKTQTYWIPFSAKKS